MKFIHLSDLHLGKRVNEFSMLEDQQYILLKIIGIVKEQKPDAVFIAGDIYDKSVPSTEAIELLDEFLVQLNNHNTNVFIISGNHDSAERLAFGGRIMQSKGVHISKVYDGSIEPITMTDEYGTVNIYMLPFVKPQNVRRFYPEENIESYTDAIKVALTHANIDTNARNVLITHQFVTGAERSESEDISVGGTDNVDSSVFDGFDYVALGHIHRPQNIGSERIRYCGTPLKYSFSECTHNKSVTIVELQDKGNIKVDTIPLVPKYDMVEIKGDYNTVVSKDFWQNTNYKDSYIHITLTDEQDIVDAINKLRVVYPRLMKLDYDNTRTRTNNQLLVDNQVEQKSPLQLFKEFYCQQNNTDMTDEQEQVVSELIQSIWGE